ncbi:MAG: DUF4160 domain-containing protein [Schleiferiaceae bacterium]
MPNLLSLDGIQFIMYTRDHPPPHIHVFYSGLEYVVFLNTIEFLRNVPPPKLRKKISQVVLKNQADWIAKFNTFSRLNYEPRQFLPPTDRRDAP